MQYNRREVSWAFPPVTNIIKWLLISNIALFVAINYFTPQSLVEWIEAYFSLTPELVFKRGFVWQFGTYMFLHGDFFHLLFNMFALWMFGSSLEQHWGGKKFLKYYFITGIGAGLFSIFFNWFGSMIGASGAIYGILLAFALTFPNREIRLLFILPIKAKYLALIFGALQFFLTILDTNSRTAHYAHLGGMVVGLIYLIVIPYVQKKIKSLQQELETEKAEKEEEKREEVVGMVNTILDKINREGIDSLTEHERHILKQAGDYLNDSTSKSQQDNNF